MRHDGRANPHQLVIDATTRRDRRPASGPVAAQRGRYGAPSDLVVGLQLTHSGRCCAPERGNAEPRIAYHHPLLDPRVGLPAASDAC